MWLHRVASFFLSFFPSLSFFSFFSLFLFLLFLLFFLSFLSLLHLCLFLLLLTGCLACWLSLCISLSVFFFITFFFFLLLPYFWLVGWLFSSYTIWPCFILKVTGSFNDNSDHDQQESSLYQCLALISTVTLTIFLSQTIAMGFELVFPSREENAASYGPSTLLTVWAEACWCKPKESTSLHPQEPGEKNQGSISRWVMDPAELLRDPAAELWHLGQPWCCSVSPVFKHRHSTPTEELSQIPWWTKDRGHMLFMEEKTQTVQFYEELCLSEYFAT